jgi:hypothetical protein
LVLAPNEHYWRVLDIANQKARMRESWYTGVEKPWTESPIGKKSKDGYWNDEKDNEVRGVKRQGFGRVVGWVKANQADDR